MDSANVKKELFEIMQDGKEHRIFDLVKYFKDKYGVDRVQVSNAINMLRGKGKVNKVARGVYIIEEGLSGPEEKSILETLNNTMDKVLMIFETSRINVLEYVSDSINDEERSEIDRKIQFMKKIYDEICEERNIFNCYESIMPTEEKYKCPTCGYEYIGIFDLDFDEEERVPCCPVCKNLIESEYEE